MVIQNFTFVDDMEFNLEVYHPDVNTVSTIGRTRAGGWSDGLSRRINSYQVGAVYSLLNTLCKRAAKQLHKK